MNRVIQAQASETDRRIGSDGRCRDIIGIDLRVDPFQAFEIVEQLSNWLTSHMSGDPEKWANGWK